MSTLNSLLGKKPLAPAPSRTAAGPPAMQSPASRAIVAQPKPLGRFADAVAQDTEERKAAAANRSDPANRLFWQKKGAQCMVIILDQSLNDETANFYRNIHTLPDGEGHFSRVEWCLKDMGIACPICKATKKKSILTGYLSVLALREWKDREGGEHVYDHVLLPVSGDLAVALLKYEAMTTQHGRDLRGMCIMLERGTTDTAVRTGLPVVFAIEGSPTPVPWTYVEEAEIAQLANNPLIKAKDGRIIKQPGQDQYAFDYRKLFGTPDVDAIMKEFGDGTTVPGSQADSRKRWEEHQQNAPDDGDEIPGIDTGSLTQEEFVRVEAEYVDPLPPVPTPTARPAAVLPGRPAVIAPRPAVVAAKPAPIAARPVPAVVPARPAIKPAIKPAPLPAGDVFHS